MPPPRLHADGVAIDSALVGRLLDDQLPVLWSAAAPRAVGGHGERGVPAR